MKAAELVKAILNDETGMEALVWDNGRGGFNVTVRDVDSGEFLPRGYVDFKTVDAAEATARELVGVRS